MENPKSKWYVTKELIESKIKDKKFTVLEDGKTTICNLYLENGFTVRGESACVDPLNFVKEIGERIAFENAFEKIWLLEGYLCQQRKHESETSSPLASTADLMISEDFKDRFKAEAYQLAIRRDGLKAMLEKWDKGELSFTPKCSRNTLGYQLHVMGDYLAILKDRAEVEGIDL